jgi:hypothetical protein
LVSNTAVCSIAGVLMGRKPKLSNPSLIVSNIDWRAS